MFIELPLAIIISLTVFSMVSNGGDIQNISQGYYSYGFQLTSAGIISFIIVIVVLASVVGINVVGSGLSDSSVRTITIGTAWGGMWLVFTVLSLPLMLSIEVFGVFIYVILTVLYVIGVYQKIGGGD